jgi:hypothetical protein
MSLPPLELPPLKGSGLFRLANEDDIDHPIACIGRNGGPYMLDAYAQGYFVAGERLIESTHKNRGDLDLLVYPVVYLYRHGVELSLKHLAERLPILLNSQGSFKWGHNLLDNWQEVRNLLVQARADYPDETSIREKTLRWVDGVLKQLMRIDPFGTTFRYPTDKHGKNRLIRKSHVNYTHFAKYMKPLSELCVRWMVSVDQMIADKS